LKKKLLTALLIVAMVLSFASISFAATFSDTADLSKDAQSSITKLNALNIINGYPDGTFKPANNITRAEFAKIACIAGGMGSSAEMLQSSPSKFADVAAGQWYTGYVNLANSQGWVKGFPDGTFRPNNQITYAEVITVLVRLLGYNDNLPGPWPVDYIAKAGAIDITEDVSFNANAPATRDDVAVMTDATLDATVVEWDNDTEDFEKKYTGDDEELTLLEDQFETLLHEDYLMTDSESDDGVWSVKLTSTDEDEEELNGDTLDLAADCAVADGTLPNNLNNKIADILYNDDDEEILYIEITSTTLTVDGEDWKYDSSDKEFEIDDVKYDKADYFQGDVYAGDGSYDPDGYYRAFINDDNEVYKVARRNEDTPAVVESVENGEISLKDEGNYGVNDEIEDIDFEDDKVLIEKDDAFVEVSDLEENDLLLADEDYCGEFDYYIEVVGDLSKTGVLEATKDDEVKIDGNWYDIAEYTLLSDDEGENFDEEITEDNLEDYNDETVTYFLNKANQVCVMVIGEAGGESNKITGVITELSYQYKANEESKIKEIKVLKADGSETTYGVDTDEVEIYEKDLLEDELIEFSVNEDNDIDNLTVLAQLKGEAGAVVKPASDTIAHEYSEDFEDDYTDVDDEYFGDITDGNNDNNRILFAGKWLTLTDDTVVFNAMPGDDPEVVDNDDLVDWADDLGGDDSVYVYVQYENTKVEYIYLNEESIDSASNEDYALVLDTYSKSGDKWVEVDIKGTTENYEVKNSGTPKDYAIYDYDITNNKFDVSANDDIVFDSEDATTGADVYGVVTDVDRSAGGVEIEGQWIYVDDETVIYDYTDYYGEDNDDPVYKSSVSAISDDDLVWVLTDNSDDDVADLIVIVTGYEEAVSE